MRNGTICFHSVVKNPYEMKSWILIKLHLSVKIRTLCNVYPPKKKTPGLLFCHLIAKYTNINIKDEAATIRINLFRFSTNLQKMYSNND